MKKIFSLIAVVIVLTSCDLDGITQRNSVTRIEYSQGEIGYRYDGYTYVDNNDDGSLDVVSHAVSGNIEFITESTSTSWDSWQKSFEQVKDTWEK